MPGAPRPSKKMQKLLEKLNGIPPAMLEFKKSEKEREIDRKLNYEQTRYIR